MSRLVFVRHAQASLFAADYDQLSALGQQQAHRMGEYMAERQIAFDEVYVGPRRRHLQTATAILNRLGTSHPAPQVVPGFDEHQVDRLATRHIDKLLPDFPELASLATAFRDAQSLEDRKKSFAKMFEAVADLWIQDRCPRFDVEPWSDFTLRVEDGIRAVLGNGAGQAKQRGRSVLVVASAGTIAAALRRALQCPDAIALGLGWKIWNCSATHFVFSQSRFSLDQFNNMAHFDDEMYWTYR